MGERLNNNSEHNKSRCHTCHSKLGGAAMKSTVASGKERPIMPSREMSQVRSSVTSGGPKAILSPSVRRIIYIELDPKLDTEDE